MTGFWIDFSANNTVILYYFLEDDDFPIELEEWDQEDVSLSDILLDANYVAANFATEELNKIGPVNIQRSDGFQLAFILELGTGNQSHFEKWMKVA